MILGMPFWVYAQPAKEEEVLLRQITSAQQRSLPQQASEANMIYVGQSGVSNQAFIQQLDAGFGVIHQAGVSNALYLQQSGFDGKVAVDQRGNGNDYIGFVYGDGLDSSVLQLGESNQIYQTLLGSELRIEIIQQGSHNEIQQSAEGTSSGLRISQLGSDMKLIIKTRN